MKEAPFWKIVLYYLGGLAVSIAILIPVGVLFAFVKPHISPENTAFLFIIGFLGLLLYIVFPIVIPLFFMRKFGMRFFTGKESDEDLEKKEMEVFLKKLRG